MTTQQQTPGHDEQSAWAALGGPLSDVLCCVAAASDAPARELATYSLVCKGWHAVLKGDAPWAAALRRQFGYEAQSAEERRLGCRHLLIRALTGRLYLAGQCPAGLGCSPSSARFTTPEHLLLSGGGSDSGQPVSLHAAAAGPRSPRAGRGCSISIRAVAAGADFAVLLTWDGAVLDTRCLASRATSPRRQQQGSSFDWSGLWRPPPGCRPVAVAAGGCWQGSGRAGGHVLVVTDQHTVWAWGVNSADQMQVVIATSWHPARIPRCSVRPQALPLRLVKTCRPPAPDRPRPAPSTAARSLTPVASMGGASSSEGAIPKGMEILAEIKPGYEEILSRDALDFLAKLSRKYSGRVTQLLERRREQQARFDAGEKPAFLPETKKIREGDWKVAPLPADFQDRRVEITGPTDRKMVINALNSGANVYMPDFEDSNCPTWDNMVQGQINLRDAVRGTVSYEDPNTGKKYALKEGKRAIMVCRPRGWHLWEHHVLVDGQAVPGAIFDFALYFFHNAKQLLANGNGPYFYLPKMQSHLECRLWNEIFVDAQKALGIPNGTIKATCLIETLPAAFEMDEFIYELRDHMAGLNCGRWDYMFSFIKTMRNDPNRVMPDRSFLTMEMPFMRAYTQLVVKTCHKRGCFAMGGMSAVIPIKGDEAANNAVMEKVRADKLREVKDGHDGTWVAHPALIPIAKEVFDEHMKTPNQIDRQRDDVQPDAEALLMVPEGPKTEATLRNNINVCILYMAAWIGGTGCVPLHNLMEDAATAEISRAQVWQWVRYGAKLDCGKTVTAEMVRQVIEEEVEALQKQLGTEKFAAGEYLDAAFLTKLMCCGRELHDFLTLPAQDIIIAMGK